jgi:hypothetical protein
MSSAVTTKPESYTGMAGERSAIVQDDRPSTQTTPSAEEGSRGRWTKDLPLVRIGERCPDGPHRHTSSLHKTQCDIEREIAMADEQATDPVAESPVRAVEDWALDSSRHQTTVRVRVLVAIDDKGDWTAVGLSRYEEADCRDVIFTDDLGEHLTYHWVEADVPIPAPLTIEGIVQNA